MYVLQCGALYELHREFDKSAILEEGLKRPKLFVNGLAAPIRSISICFHEYPLILEQICWQQ